jgi:glycosyltransferase involved in cell wall biosynthesis
VDFPFALRSRLHLLTRSTGWYGNYSGYYEQIPKYISDLAHGTQISTIKSSFLRRLGGKALAYRYGIGHRNQSFTYSEWLYLREINRSKHVGLVLSFEDHGPMFESFGANTKNIVATLHFPPALTQKNNPPNWSKLDHAIVLYRRDIEFFEKYIGKDRVKFAPHGVDTDFFCPRETDSRKQQICFVGQFGRNVSKFVRVVVRLLDAMPELQVKIVMAAHGLKNPEFDPLRVMSEVTFLSGVSDEILRETYRDSACMVLPMIDSGANNAVLEAMACGTPIVTEDVGGIRDYGGGDIFPLCQTASDDEMIDLAIEYLKNTQRQAGVAHDVRKMCVDHFTWTKSAQAHLETIKHLLG